MFLSLRLRSQEKQWFWGENYKQPHRINKVRWHLPELCHHFLFSVGGKRTDSSESLRVAVHVYPGHKECCQLATFGITLLWIPTTDRPFLAEDLWGPLAIPGKLQSVCYMRPGFLSSLLFSLCSAAFWWHVRDTMQVRKSRLEICLWHKSSIFNRGRHIRKYIVFSKDVFLWHMIEVLRLFLVGVYDVEKSVLLRIGLKLLKIMFRLHLVMIHFLIFWQIFLM